MYNNSYKNYTFAVKVNGRFLTEYSHSKTEETFIEGREGSEYTLFFKNNTYDTVLFVPSVDGLSVLDGSTASHKSRGYVVNALQSIEVPGWTLSNSTVAAFKFGGVGSGKTYVEALDNAGFKVDPRNQGVIGCMVFQRKYVPPVYRTYYNDFAPKYVSNPMWTTANLDLTAGSVFGQGQNTIYASAEAYSMNTASLTRGSSMAASSEPAPSLGTQQGRDVAFATTETTFERMDVPSWIGVIQYDTISNLRKRGVIVDTPVKSAFPGYNPAACPDLR